MARRGGRPREARARCLTHVIDTAGAYIPGHGTPTVIIFGKNQPPIAPTIRTVLGIRGEPATPENPAQGLVWQAILRQVDDPGSESEWMSAADSPRANFRKHPSSIGGGGMSELKEQIEENAGKTLDQIAEHMGITAVTGADDLLLFPDQVSLRRLRIEHSREFVVGDIVRHWCQPSQLCAAWVFDDDFKVLPLTSIPNTHRVFWSCRTLLGMRRRFGTPMIERGLAWYEWQELYVEKLRTSLTIVFPFVSTHNHFVLERGAKVFNRTSPVIKLPADASVDEHLELMAVLNSSTASFWMKQIFHNKGDSTDQHGARTTGEVEFNT